MQQPRLPGDFTETEYELYTYLVTGDVFPISTSGVYALIEDPIDKFLVAYVFELGNTRRQAEVALGLSKATIWKRINKIRAVLYNHFRNQ